LLEFTGERLIPGRAEPDLWNEHLSRYRFAARLARHKRVLDVGCGAGYGAAELGRVASSVVACDLSPEAPAFAASRYRAPHVHFLAADARSVPFCNASFDLIVAFEVLEHLDDWHQFLEESRRLLAPRGQFIVSTPNRLYYAETRKVSGPNPFHRHEFDFDEFRDALGSTFASITIYLQNHADGIVIQPASEGGAAAELAVEPCQPQPDQSHFLLAVCALSPQTGAPTWVYLPSTANVLREREQHIDKLELELRQKDDWLETLTAEHARLVEMHTELTEELRQTRDSLSLFESRAKAAELQYQILFDSAAETNRGYEAKITALEDELTAAHANAAAHIARLEEELTVKVGEAVASLHAVEAELEERTRWALDLQQRLERVEMLLHAAQASRWIRLGRRIGFGPDLDR
jgi:SAM-dependent methyltransferase